jgi:hypothetical protein
MGHRYSVQRAAYVSVRSLIIESDCLRSSQLRIGAYECIYGWINFFQTAQGGVKKFKSRKIFICQTLTGFAYRHVAD